MGENGALPRAVLLDLDDTILDDSGETESCWKDACLEHADTFGLSADETYAAILQSREWYWSDPDRHRRGRLDPDMASREVVERALTSLGTIDKECAVPIATAYRRERRARMQPIRGAVETVEWLRREGCGLALVTNGSALEQRSKIERFDLARLFDAILIEGELGIGKPNPEVYRQAMRALGTTAADSWMVGDNLDFDVAEPQRMGLRGIWIDVRAAGLPDGHPVRPHRILRALFELRSPSG